MVYLEEVFREIKYEWGNIMDTGMDLLGFHIMV